MSKSKSYDEHGIKQGLIYKSRHGLGRGSLEMWHVKFLS